MISDVPTTLYDPHYADKSCQVVHSRPNDWPSKTTEIKENHDFSQKLTRMDHLSRLMCLVLAWGRSYMVVATSQITQICLSCLSWVDTSVRDRWEAFTGPTSALPATCQKRHTKSWVPYSMKKNITIYVLLWVATTLRTCSKIVGLMPS